ncbi:MAG: hypothetical protein R3C56_22690 [Pirellulaceae bacterium]
MVISGRTTVDDGGLAGLANCPELKVLAIDGLWVGSPGLEHLKGNLKLIELYASGTTIDDAASALAGWLSQPTETQTFKNFGGYCWDRFASQAAGSMTSISVKPVELTTKRSRPSAICNRSSG